MEKLIRKELSIKNDIDKIINKLNSYFYKLDHLKTELYKANDELEYIDINGGGLFNIFEIFYNKKSKFFYSKTKEVKKKIKLLKKKLKMKRIFTNAIWHKMNIINNDPNFYTIKIYVKRNYECMREFYDMKLNYMNNKLKIQPYNFYYKYITYPTTRKILLNKQYSITRKILLNK